MLSRFALQLEKPLVRRGLVLVGVVGTLYLAPMVLFGAYMGIAALFFPGVTERLMYFPVGALGIGGAVGIAAAWCRVLASNRKRQTSKAFFVFTVVGLGIGVVTAVVYGSLGLFGDGALGGLSSPLAWSFVAVAIMGAALLGGTIGARGLPSDNTVERDGPQAP